MENTRKGCINRDYNGCINIRKLFNSYINNKPRPQQYCRGYEIKTTNPCKKVSTTKSLLHSKIYNFTKVSNGGRLERRKEYPQRVHLHSPEIKIS